MLACLLMALSGFLIFGDRTLGNVLNNFPSDNTMVNIARLCFGLNMLTTLPLEAFVCREVMLNYYFPGEPFSMNLHLLFTTSLVFSAMVLSLLTCDLGSVFDLVGGTSAAAMAYILPPLCYVKLTTRSWRTYAAWGVVVFGCVVMAMSLFEAIGKMITGKSLSAGLTCLLWLMFCLQARGIQSSAIEHQHIYTSSNAFPGLFWACFEIGISTNNHHVKVKAGS